METKRNEIGLRGPDRTANPQRTRLSTRPQRAATEKRSLYIVTQISIIQNEHRTAQYYYSNKSETNEENVCQLQYIPYM